MSFFSGGSQQTSWPTDYPQGSPAEQAAKKSGEVAQQMLEEQKLQRADNEAQAEEVQLKADVEQKKADKLAEDDENMRLQRIRGGGLQRFMTAGYSGYGDTRTLGQSQYLGT